jgi:hypothetical protein
MKISGILMIIAGFAAILFGGFSYQSHDQVPDMGLIQVVDTEYHPVRIPPILGMAGMVMGGGMVYFGRKPRRLPFRRKQD